MERSTAILFTSTGKDDLRMVLSYAHGHVTD